MSNEEIKQFFTDLYASESGNYRNFEVEVLKGAPNIHVKVSQMYEYVDKSFATLTKISEHFGTKEISTDEWSSDGCPTCDYGSNYEVEFHISLGGENVGE